MKLYLAASWKSLQGQLPSLGAWILDHLFLSRKYYLSGIAECIYCARTWCEVWIRPECQFRRIKSMKFGAKKNSLVISLHFSVVLWSNPTQSPTSSKVCTQLVTSERECTRLIFSLCNHFGVTLTSDDKVCLGKLGRISYFPHFIQLQSTSAQK